jgi:hypothetical protein
MSTSTHHHRRYSWPPSLQLVDVSHIEIPLPDINDDPFAHFLSKAPPEEDIEAAIDALTYRAGIDSSTITTVSKRKETAFKFRASIALKFSRLIDKYLQRDVARRLKRDSAVSRRTIGPSVVEGREPTLGHAQVLLAESDARRRKSTRKANAHRFRHSWHAPADALYTIIEE